MVIKLVGFKERVGFNNFLFLIVELTILLTFTWLLIYP